MKSWFKAKTSEKSIIILHKVLKFLEQIIFKKLIRKTFFLYETKRTKVTESALMTKGHASVSKKNKPKM
jgi:hypothetical protein